MQGYVSFAVQNSKFKFESQVPLPEILGGDALRPRGSHQVRFQI